MSVNFAAISGMIPFVSVIVGGQERQNRCLVNARSDTAGEVTGTQRIKSGSVWVPGIRAHTT